MGVGGDQRADFAKERRRSHPLRASRRAVAPSTQAPLEWGLSTRPRLAKLDVELAAYTLLAAGEQAIKLVLANPDTFTAERYQRFASSILATL